MFSSTQKPIEGFSLIELLLAVGISSVVLGLGIPSFKTLVTDNQLVTSTNKLVFDINYARSEAVKRGERVVVCRSANPNSSTPACNGGSKNWSSGWIAFVMGDSTNSFDPPADTLIRANSGVNSTISLNSNLAAPTFQFKPDGSLDSNAISTFAVCDKRGVKKGRQIQINVVGRVRLVSGSISDCNNPVAM